MWPNASDLLGQHAMDNEIAIEPSPTADARRVMLPHRTSPTTACPDVTFRAKFSRTQRQPYHSLVGFGRHLEPRKCASVSQRARANDVSEALAQHGGRPEPRFRRDMFDSHVGRFEQLLRPTNAS